MSIPISRPTLTTHKQRALLRGVHKCCTLYLKSTLSACYWGWHCPTNARKEDDFISGPDEANLLVSARVPKQNNCFRWGRKTEVDWGAFSFFDVSKMFNSGFFHGEKWFFDMRGKGVFALTLMLNGASQCFRCLKVETIISWTQLINFRLRTHSGCHCVIHVTGPHSLIGYEAKCVCESETTNWSEANANALSRLLFFHMGVKWRKGR